MSAPQHKTGSLRAARFFWCFATIQWFGSARADDALSQPEAASGFAPRPAVTAQRYAAVTAHPAATAAAVEILDLGGSAVDAAIAAQFVLNVVEPQSSGVGGGGFLLHYDAARRRVAAYDGRETAPAGATPRRFVSPDGRPMAFRDAVASGRSVGVPGLVALLGLVHERHGRLKWERLLCPAIRLAENGFPVSPRLHKLLAADVLLPRDATARQRYYTTDGSAQPVGAMLVLPELASTLRGIAAQGPTFFYRPPMADRIVAAVARAGGDLAVADLRDYRAIERTPVCGNYRTYRVCGMPPPSSGGVTLLEMLGLLERTGFAAHAPESPAAFHLFAEAGRLAYADRRRYLADPAFVAVPAKELLREQYLDARAALIRADHSLGRAPPGEFPGYGGFRDDSAPERPSTTHLSIVDARGNAVAMTSSVEDAFGSRIMAEGFVLNNQLTDFSFLPLEADVQVANRVEPGKRPLSSMAPTLVFDKNGRLYAVLGSAGGSRIINYVARTLTALIDGHLSAEAAVAAPQVGSRNGPTEVEQGRAATSLIPALERLGHRVEVVDMTSGTQLLVREGGRWRGAADPRREGAAAGR